VKKIPSALRTGLVGVLLLGDSDDIEKEITELDGSGHEVISIIAMSLISVGKGTDCGFDCPQ